MTTAAEFGYRSHGIDTRAAAVDSLVTLGYDCQCVDFQQCFSQEQCSLDVVSMCDVLEHIAFPRDALRKAWHLLKLGGILFLSMPNRDCLTWRLMDKEGSNPYWGELEHFHNFSRAGLYQLLHWAGFAPISYGVSERYRACMEVVAVRTDSVPESDDCPAHACEAPASPS